jgi:radical SAM superfamily enzyme YgiQ (UPF0313 family)
MKVLFVNPRKSGRGQASGRYLAATPLALPLLAALTPDDIETEIIDENIRPINFDEKVDLVAMTVMIHLVPRALEVAHEFRKRGMKVIVGGIYPSLHPEKFEQYVDSIGIGEGEGVWPAIIEDLRKGVLKRQYRAGRLIDMKEVPFMKKEFFENSECYHIETTRGCPYACDYCSVTEFYGNKYRTRPIENVVRQVEELRDKMIFFVDDNIAANKKYVKELFKAITPLRVAWGGQFSLNFADDLEFLRLARESGCMFLFTGIESINQRNLDQVNKGWSKAEDYSCWITNMHDAGIAIYASFMFGFDHDEPDVFEKTLAFCEANKVDLALFSCLTPREGSKLYAELERDGRILEEDLSLRNGQNVIFRPKGMTIEQLDQGLKWIWNNFYSKRSIKERLARYMCNIGYAAAKTGRRTSMNFSGEEMLIFLNMAFRIQVSTF